MPTPNPFKALFFVILGSTALTACGRNSLSEPDTDSVVFSSDRDGQQEIYVIGPDGLVW